MGAFIEMVPSRSTTRATADRVLRQLGRARARSDHEICVWLLAGFRLSVHTVHGYASFREYAERVFGFSGRAIEERLRTASALEHLPKLSAAFEAGGVLYSVVREVSRVAVPDTEEQWLAAVEGKKAAEVERMISGRERGDGPADPRKAEAERHRVGLNLGGSARALWEQARQVATRRSGGTHLSDDDFVTQLAQTYLTEVARGRDATVGEGASEAGTTRTSPKSTSTTPTRPSAKSTSPNSTNEEAAPPYGSPKTDGVASKKLADVFDILCSLGFPQTQARKMLDRVRPHVGADTSTERAVKLALRQASVPSVREDRAEYLPVHELDRRRAAPRWGPRLTVQSRAELARPLAAVRWGPGRTVQSRGRARSAARRPQVGAGAGRA